MYLLQATEMIIQLREYESGEYGLAEAVSEIKELRQQRRVRDKQIEELVQASNKLQAEAGHLEEQNLALRYWKQLTWLPLHWTQ